MRERKLELTSIIADRYFTKEEQEWMLSKSKKYDTYRDVTRALYRNKDIEDDIKLLSTRVRRFMLVNDIELPSGTDVDHSFFDKIDTEEKAYMLGFIVADGSIQIKTEHLRFLKISLHKKDADILNKFSKCIGYKKRLSVRKDKPQVAMTVSSKCMVDNLVNLGVVPNKTYEGTNNLYIPKGDLFRHFLRGLIGGDGWLCYVKNGKFYYGHVGVCQNINSKKLLLKIKYILESEFNIQSKYKEKIDKRNNRIPMCSLEFRSVKNTLNIINFLYSDATIYLDRKYKIAMDILENTGVRTTKYIK